MLNNIPNVDAYIIKRTANYIGKIARTNDHFYPKKFLAAWIVGKKKSGAPQLTCNNNFAKSIQKILPPMNKLGLLREWIPIAKDAANWKQYIEDYFECCKNTDYQVESDEEYDT